MKFSKESIEIKRLVRNLYDMGTYGLVELELIEMERREEKLRRALKDARDLLILYAVLDNKGHCLEMVERINKQICL